MAEVDARLRPAPAGTLVSLRRGTVHAFKNPTDDEAQLLITFIPGDFEGFFVRLRR